MSTTANTSGLFSGASIDGMDPSDQIALEGLISGLMHSATGDEGHAAHDLLSTTVAHIGYQADMLRKYHNLSAEMILDALLSDLRNTVATSGDITQATRVHKLYRAHSGNPKSIDHGKVMRKAFGIDDNIGSTSVDNG